MWPETDFDMRLRTPFGGIICGGTMSGKTHYVARLIKNRSQVFDQKFDRIIYVYDEWQNLYEDLVKSVPEIPFTKNITQVFEDEDFFDSDEKTLLILDDVANSLADNALASKLFTQKIHHRNVSILFPLNNLYK